MNLILQAIKSLFRGMENKLSSNVASLTRKITTAQDTATKANSKATDAYDYADIANNAANDAKNMADEARVAASHVLNASVSGTTATVSGKVNLENGAIYVIIPANATTNIGPAYIKVNGKSIPVRMGVSERSATGYSTASVDSDKLFCKATPVMVLYSQEAGAFYAMNKHQSFVRTNEPKYDPIGGEYVYAQISGNSAKLIKYMRVVSSTPGSNKKFDIKVDDSGTITAEEVTE